MDNFKMPAATVLTEDERLVADFIKTRTDKVLADIKSLAQAKDEDPVKWSQCFTYLAKTYGRDSDETFKWFKYYFREGLIPSSIVVPLAIQIYLDSKVDGGFVNILSRGMKQEPEAVKTARIEEMKRELAAYIGEDGMLTVYRGAFEKPFGKEPDASRTIDRAFAFTLEKEVAHHYACCWFPQKASVYEVKTALSDVAWYSCYDEEKTVILLPQSKGGAWKVSAEQSIAKEDYNNAVTESEAFASYHALFA